MNTTSNSRNGTPEETRTDWAEDRTIMANERTFAGWVGTGMGAIGLAIGLQAVFGAFDPTWLAKAVATLFLGIALTIFWSARSQAMKTYQRLTEHDAEAHEARDFTRIVLLLSVGTFGIGVILWLI